MKDETKSLPEHPYADLIKAGQWYDHGTGKFELKQNRFGLWISNGEDGTEHVTALTKEACFDATVFHLHGKKYGFPEEARSYDGTVGGKL